MGDSNLKNASGSKLKIGFIGGGNMAKAISEGIVRAGLVSYGDIIVSGPHLENLTEWKNKGSTITCSNGQAAEWADVIFLAIKPHILPQAVANIHDSGDVKKIVNKLFVSILAGVKLESLENVLKYFEGARIIRVMPNTPMMVGAGCTVFCPNSKATSNDQIILKKMLDVCGVSKMVPESLIDASGALAGCGPAYVYLMIEAMSDGAVRMGIPRPMATEFAAQTMLGAAKMVLTTGKHPGQLKDEVCSAGGSTIAGVHALEQGGVRVSLMNAIEAATKRSTELGKKD